MIFSPTSLRSKDSFYLDEQTGQRARDLHVRLVEEQMEAGGTNNNNQTQCKVKLERRREAVQAFFTACARGYAGVERDTWRLLY